MGRNFAGKQDTYTPSHNSVVTRNFLLVSMVPLGQEFRKHPLSMQTTTAAWPEWLSFHPNPRLSVCQGFLHVVCAADAGKAVLRGTSARLSTSAFCVGSVEFFISGSLFSALGSQAHHSSCLPSQHSTGDAWRVDFASQARQMGQAGWKSMLKHDLRRSRTDALLYWRL